MLAVKSPGGCGGGEGWWLLGEIRGSLCIMAMSNLEMSESGHKDVK